MSSSLDLQTKQKLRDGNEIPVIGYGTYELDGKDAYNGVLWALEAGYRHIDSAAWYENEKECSQAITDFCKTKNIPRSDIFFTTKLKANQGYAATQKAIDASLKECGKIDLYLIHGPLGGPKARQESWRAICDAQRDGKFTSIGVSNFGLRHLGEFVEAGVPLPVINQIDLHPFMTRTKIVAFCRENNIALEAWAPLVRGWRFDHSSIVKLAQKYSKEPAHVLLRYSLQKGYITLPKSAHKTRIISNTKIYDFELSDAEMDHLDSLNEDLVTDWDPSDCP